MRTPNEQQQRQIGPDEIQLRIINDVTALANWGRSLSSNLADTNITLKYYYDALIKINQVTKEDMPAEEQIVAILSICKDTITVVQKVNDEH